jgi:hypothetical protein
MIETVVCNLGVLFCAAIMMVRKYVLNDLHQSGGDGTLNLGSGKKMTR